MEKEQIAHDLAVAKLYGSNLQTEDLINQYRKYAEEILSALKSEPKKPNRESNVIESPV